MGYTCDICRGYIHDYMWRPMRPDSILFKDVHGKRVQQIIPEFIGIFERFFREINDFQLSIAACIIDKDAKDLGETDDNVLKRSSYKSMGKWFNMFSNDYGLATVLIHEHCVTKIPDELIGYWLSELFVIKEIHMEHSRIRIEAKPESIFLEVDEDELYR